MLKLKLPYFGHLMGRAEPLEMTGMLGKTEGRRRRGQHRMIWLDGLTHSMGMNLSKLREVVKDREAWCSAVHGVTKSQTQLKVNNNPQRYVLRSISSVPPIPFGSAGKESACSVGDLGSVPGLGRSPGERNGYPLQYSCPLHIQLRVR